MTPSDERSIADTVAPSPAPTDGQISHLSIKHGQHERAVLDENPQMLFPFSQRCLYLFAGENVFSNQLMDNPV